MTLVEKRNRMADRRAGERRRVCLLDFMQERRSGRDRRSGFDRRTILKILCTHCRLPLFSRPGNDAGLAYEPRAAGRPAILWCPHCHTPHEECERYIGYSKEVTFRNAGTQSLAADKRA